MPLAKMDCLPESFRYVICDCTITDRDSHAFSVTLRAAIESESQVKQWLDEFSKKTNSQWVVRRTYPKVERLTYRTDYVCQHSDHNKGMKGTKAARKCDCQAKLTAKIKIVNKDTRYKDVFVKVSERIRTITVVLSRRPIGYQL